MVSVLVFYSDNPSSNPGEGYSFSEKIVFEKNKNKQKEAHVNSLQISTNVNAFPRSLKRM